MGTPNVYGDLRHRCKDKAHYQRCCRLIRRGMGLEEAFELSRHRGDGLSTAERKKNIYISCETCGKTILTTAWKVARSQHHFCSRSCSAEYKNSLIPSIPAETFRELYQCCKPYLPGLLYRLSRKYQVVGRLTQEELEQEMIICIHKHAHQSPTEPTAKRIFWCLNLKWHLSRYITRIVLTREPSTDVLRIYDDTDPYEICRTREIAQFLDQADDYKLLLKHSFERVTTEELCKEYGCNAHALGIRLSRARARLAEDLRDY